ncbi:4Fe-4S binding protein [Haloplanus aerogenes]|uniref:4Fe-4S binding protein n=1 Tax=Haloplanus aerogenes TaxID=660522 RepID=A0A3M0CRY1_9EURY|nr:4Fe-4S binding protein [Haloplanus aerogenes]AZH25967.1 4Fe-4S binding protein [Haloplanus aerogenes]RMB11665.1 NosR/NirI family nitrous oxide reductase transcriptional regulator [Haloplanus aerogenes]
MFDRRTVTFAAAALLVVASLSPVVGLSAAARDPGAAQEQLVTEPFAERNLRKVVPAADEFSDPTGPYRTVRAYEVVDGERRLVGYAFLTSNVVDTVGFSDRPVEFLVGIDTEGTITGVQLVEQHEPFFQRRATRTRLRELGDQLVGLSVTRDVVFEDPDADEYEVDAITRATVTSEVTVETIMRSSRLVARHQEVVSDASVANETDGNRTGTRVERAAGANRGEVRRLAVSESLERWNVSASALGVSTDAGPVGLYVTPLDSERTGDRLLGDQRHDRLRDRWPGTTFVWIGLDGIPDGWNADTLAVRQHARQFDATPIRPSVQGVDWSAVVVVRADRFDPTRPFAVVVTSDGRTVSRTYIPPGTGTVAALVARTTPDWLHEVRSAWERAWPESLLLVVGLSLVAGLFALRRRLLATEGVDVSYDAIRHIVLAVSLLFIGWYRPAQPTSQQLAAFVREMITWLTGGGFDWVLFFSMPLILLVLGFFALTVVVWGRGTFCGWVCPFGALSELLYRLTPWEHELPRRHHERLEKLRYPLFVLIVVGVLVSTNVGATLAKVEPFKAAFYYSLVSNPFYVGWSLLLVVAGAVVFRPYCRYLCPLGAGLSFGNVLQQREIQRYDLCGDCVKCQTDCEFQAIRDDGSIARQQCFQCSVCVENYYDPDSCPVLLQYDPEDGDWSAAWEDPALIERIRPADRTREQRRILAVDSDVNDGASGSDSNGSGESTDRIERDDISTEWDDDSSTPTWPTDTRHERGDGDA